MAMFLACALIVGLVERAVPLPVAIPGVRPGLANVVILTALYLFSFRQVLLLVILKCVMTAFFSGSAVSFLYSLSGSLLSFFVMWLLLRFFGERLSTVGVSVAGAVFHNIGQIAAAALVMGTWLIAWHLPVLLLSGVITGILTGILVRLVLPAAKRLADMR